MFFEFGLGRRGHDVGICVVHVYVDDIFVFIIFVLFGVFVVDVYIVTIEASNE